ncbi:hypothetical protein CHARACLAT_024434 [Characodon lateralis]|uniref:Uncharacterized protein n=1 Tax=Characodon lateralis TaxID=208331 RepID=A0ABU7D9K5_9TELE|nr:hypothetical protein [Characodon lateralis]
MASRMWLEHQHRQNQGTQPPAGSLHSAFRYPQAIPTPPVPTTPAIVTGWEPGMYAMPRQLYTPITPPPPPHWTKLRWSGEEAKRRFQ